LTTAGEFVYDKKRMNKNLEKIFPLLVAVLSFVFYQALYRPRPHSLEMAAALLLFFTALAWSALIFLTGERRHWLRFAYLALAVLFSILLVEVIRFFPGDLLTQRLLFGFNLLGIAIIEAYLHIIKKEQGKPHD
jgi:hypothetical protein